MKEETTCWVMQAQATEKSGPAQASVSKPLAENLVCLLLLGGRDLKAALREGGVFETTPEGERLSTSSLSVLFQCHCVVIAGALPASYFPRCYARRQYASRRVCTCSTFAQRSHCPHVWYVAALEHEVDLSAIPTRPPVWRTQPGCKATSAMSTQKTFWCS